MSKSDAGTVAYVITSIAKNVKKGGLQKPGNIFNIHIDIYNCCLCYYS